MSGKAREKDKVQRQKTRMKRNMKGGDVRMSDGIRKKEIIGNEEGKREKKER